MVNTVITPVVPTELFSLIQGVPLVWTPDRIAQVVTIVKSGTSLLANINILPSLLNPTTLALTAVIGGVLVTIAVIELGECCPDCPEGTTPVAFPVCCSPPSDGDVEVDLPEEGNFNWITTYLVYEFVRYNRNSQPVHQRVYLQPLQEDLPLGVPLDPIPEYVRSVRPNFVTGTPPFEPYNYMRTTISFFDSVPNELFWLADDTLSYIGLNRVVSVGVGDNSDVITTNTSDHIEDAFGINRFPADTDLGLTSVGTALEGEYLIRRRYLFYEVTATDFLDPSFNAILVATDIQLLESYRVDYDDVFSYGLPSSCPTGTSLKSFDMIADSSFSIEFKLGGSPLTSLDIALDIGLGVNVCFPDVPFGSLINSWGVSLGNKITADASNNLFRTGLVLRSQNSLELNYEEE